VLKGMLSFGTLNPALACILSARLLPGLVFWPNCGVSGSDRPAPGPIFCVKIGSVWHWGQEDFVVETI